MPLFGKESTVDSVCDPSLKDDVGSCGNLSHFRFLFPGGCIECLPSRVLMYRDRNTGEPQPVRKPNSVLVTLGNQRVFLDYHSIKAITHLYCADPDFGHFVDSCVDSSVGRVD